jgi:N-acetyl-anhydromuramyl-L-alanine amidase AmpD
MVSIRDLQAKIKRAYARMASDHPRTAVTARARRVVARARAAITAERRRRRAARVQPPPATRITSSKGWSKRPTITPRVLILHSTESNCGSGLSISKYLARADVQADVHVVIDCNGKAYRLVPDGRKAWHVAAANGYTLGIEQVGRAAQTSWPDAQVRAAAKQMAYWCRKYNIPVRHSSTHGIAYHRDVSGPGGHWDPGYHYPLDKFLKLVRSYL